MVNFIFLITTAVITYFPSGYSFHRRLLALEQRVTPCIFGPFKDTAMNCVTTHGKFTGCILKNSNWFHLNGELGKRVVLSSFKAYVVNREFQYETLNLVSGCVDKANTNVTTRKNTGEKFVKCLDNKNAFADLFPKVFCEPEQKNDPVLLTKDSAVDEEIDDVMDHAFLPNTSVFNALSMFLFENSELGPFKENAKKCRTSDDVFHSCFFTGLGYFTEDNRVNITQVLNSIRPYVINLGSMKIIESVMDKCVKQANSNTGTKIEVGEALVACWNKENCPTLFLTAFCPQLEKRDLH